MKFIPLIIISIFITGCSITNYMPSKVYTECDYFTEISPNFSVELISSAENINSVFSFQIIRKHSHNMVEISGNEKFTYYNESNRIASTTTFLALILAGLGALTEITPIYYIAGIGVVGSWIGALFSPEFTDPNSEEILVDTKRLPVSGEITCPITTIIHRKEDIKISCNNRETVVRSDKYGIFSIDLMKSFGYNNKNLPSEISLSIASENLLISETLRLKTYKNVNSFLQRSPSKFETAEQYTLAEKVLWNSSSKNKIRTLSKGIYFLPASYNRQDAIEKIKNQRLLSLLVTNIEEFELRKYAFNKLDKNSLLYLSESSEDKGLTLACKLKLNLVTWKPIFNNPDKTDDDLRNIVRAASLIEDPLPDDYDIVRICHLYIGFGEESYIPELCDLLFRFGNKSLAEDYMNCGNNVLYDAGCRWGTSHGLKCSHGTGGSHRVRWGENRK